MAMILDAFVSQLVEKLGSLINDEVVMLLGVKVEIRRLKRKLQMIENVLDDAERGKIEKNMDLWLKDLRSIMYDVDDVTDEYLIETKRQNRQNLECLQQRSSTLRMLVRCCIPFCFYCRRLAFSHKIGRRIKTINNKLDEISKNRQWTELATGHKNGQKPSQFNRATSPLLHNEVVGLQIEEDMRTLVNLLVQNSEGQRHLTFGIVGMGGIGKTTLAQKIFDDEIIKSIFPIRMWVYVSKDFNEVNILRAILREAVGGSYQPEMETKVDFDRILLQVIEHKRFLLVLDDVWDTRLWYILRASLNRCAFGSRILVTSRDEGVVRQMGVKDPYHVKRLPIEDGWLLLYRKVISNMDDNARGKVEGLKEIGMKIVEKCNGHPLAIQAIGGVLSMSDASEMKWSEVHHKLGDQTWSLTKLQEEHFTEEGEVMNILYLSYQDLPPRLKPCFLYFSLFGEGFELKKSYISFLWIALGFVRAEGDLSLEEVAEGYYKELIRRNLLQLSPKAYADVGCTMHELHLSLARALTKGENYYGDFRSLRGGSQNNISYYHMSIVDEGTTVIPESLKQYERLRTLMLIGAPSIGDVPEDLFTKVRRLRILSLYGSAIINLPTSIGNLLHLRLLDISSTDLREVPEVIGCLVSLQFLFLTDCKNLQRLPRGITKLGNLRCLDFSRSPVDNLPKGIGGLQNLYELFDFVVSYLDEGSSQHRQLPGRGGGAVAFRSNLGELKNLHQITHLSIWKLERALSSEEAREASLREKLHLAFLELQWTKIHGDDVSHQCDEEEMQKIEMVFNELCPPRNLQVLSIVGFFGSMSTSWLDSCGTLLPNLTRLDLVDCMHCQRLPPLGCLPQLDFLSIKGATAIVTVGPEFMLRGHDSVPFPRLKSLFMEDMLNWEEWCGAVQEGAFPHLEVLQIWNCPKLRSLPDSLRYATNLKELRLFGLHCIGAVENLTSVKEVWIGDCPQLVVVSNLSMMESLLIQDCPSLEGMPNSLGALKQLTLLLDLEEDKLPGWLQHGELVALQKLEIYCSFHLLMKLLPRKVNGKEDDGTEWHKVRDIPHVYAEDRSIGSTYCFSYTKHPYTFDTNIPDEAHSSVGCGIFHNTHLPWYTMIVMPSLLCFHQYGILAQMSSNVSSFRLSSSGQTTCYTCR